MENNIQTAKNSKSIKSGNLESIVNFSSDRIFGIDTFFKIFGQLCLSLCFFLQILIVILFMKKDVADDTTYIKLMALVIFQIPIIIFYKVIQKEVWSTIQNIIIISCTIIYSCGVTYVYANLYWNASKLFEMSYFEYGILIGFKYVVPILLSIYLYITKQKMIKKFFWLSQAFIFLTCLGIILDVLFMFNIFSISMLRDNKLLFLFMIFGFSIFIVIIQQLLLNMSKKIYFGSTKNFGAALAPLVSNIAQPILVFGFYNFYPEDGTFIHGYDIPLFVVLALFVLYTLILFITIFIKKTINIFHHEMIIIFLTIICLAALSFSLQDTDVFFDQGWKFVLTGTVILVNLLFIGSLQIFYGNNVSTLNTIIIIIHLFMTLALLSIYLFEFEFSFMQSFLSIDLSLILLCIIGNIAIFIRKLLSYTQTKK